MRSKFIECYKSVSIDRETKLRRTINTNIELIVMSIGAALLGATQIGFKSFLYFIFPLGIILYNIINANEKLKSKDRNLESNTGLK